MDNLVGLSFGYCLADLATGKVNIERVYRIVTGTNVVDFSKLIDQYRSSYGSPISSLTEHQITLLRIMVQKLVARETFIQVRNAPELDGFEEDPTSLWEVRGLVLSYKKREFTGGYIPLTLIQGPQAHPDTSNGHWLTFPEYKPVSFT